MLPNLPGGSGSSHVAINGNGVIAGHSGTGHGMHAVRWSPAGVITDLGTLPGHDESFARDVNADGTAVGNSDLPSDRDSGRAVRWAPNGTATNLGLLFGGTYSSARAVNDAGVIVGNATNARGEIHAFAWRDDSGVIIGRMPG